MPADRSTYEQGLLGTDIMILRRWANPEGLPDETAITAIFLAELSAGPHEVRRDDERSGYDEHVERARRPDVLRRTENEFDPVPFDADAARIHGRICAAVIGAGREPRRRVADLMIAAIVAVEDLLLFTTGPDVFKGLDDLLTAVPVTRPKVPHEG
ncbi:PIN domain-containing protein [Streptomyces minutiscleroticus]|uniref:PIN domain-containing protein n=1 Tax=Streptomyces minutiscleroticus TaxID=68238 RepID=UPI00332C0E88